MSDEKTQIVRYPNRRFYDRRDSKYVSLRDIEQMVRRGSTVEIVDSQTGEELTRSILTRIIMEHQPEKMQLFPVDMLHLILRSNDVMSDFLRDYFRQSLTYLRFLQQYGGSTGSMARPIHWVKAWLDGISARGSGDIDSTGGEIDRSAAGVDDDGERQSASVAVGESAAEGEPDREEMARRIEELETRLRRLEQVGADSETT
ncbi:MAG: polyhydroxyalkanoate synthesis regulator DNA-binding domain-containing protein [Pirellulales bacterium]